MSKFRGQETFLAIPNFAREDDNLNWTQRAVLGQIWMLDQEHGCYASNSYLAEKCRVEKECLKKILSYFRKMGYIQDQQDPAKRRVIIVTHPGLVQKEAEEGEGKFSLPGGKIFPKGGENFPYSNRIDRNRKKNTPPNPPAGAGGKGLGVAANGDAGNSRKQRQEKLDEQTDATVRKIWKWWKQVKPKDDSRGRARSHIKKHIKAGYTPKQIEDAANWFLTHQLNMAEADDPGNPDAKPDGQYIRKMSNFYGQSEEWKDWIDGDLCETAMDIELRRKGLLKDELL